MIKSGGIRMAIDVKGKVSIITGGTKGIGKGIAEALAESGSDVVIVSRHQDACDKTAAELQEKCGVQAVGIAADLRDIEQIDSLAWKVIDHFGKIDVLINNAGSAVTKPAEKLTLEDWDSVINLDLRAVFFCSQIVGRQMIRQQRGKIVNIASVLGTRGEKRVLPYCAAKGGVLQITKCLALEWARYNIQVNAICPGYVKTEINEAELADERIAGTILKRIPSRRFGEVEDIAGAAVYLASDSSDYMSGQHILIDGGWCAG